MSPWGLPRKESVGPFCSWVPQVIWEALLPTTPSILPSQLGPRIKKQNDYSFRDTPIHPSWMLCLPWEALFLNHIFFLFCCSKKENRGMSFSLFLSWESELAQLCPTLCDPMDYSLPGSSVHGIFQARVLEWVAISFFRVSSRPRNRTQVSHIVGRCFTIWATREVQWRREKRTVSRPEHS